MSNENLQERNTYKIIQSLCRERGIDFNSLCDGWIIQLSYNNQQRTLYGCHFDLNSDSSSLIAQDKYATSVLLSESLILYLEQEYFLRPTTKESQQALESQLNNYSQQDFPLVCKPNLGGAGKDVFKVSDRERLIEVIQKIHTIERGCVVSSFQDIQREYRVIILDREVLLTYSKEAPEDSWQHNISKGAKVSLDIDQETQKTLSSIAIQSTQALGLTFASVDIIEVSDTEGGEEALKVIEINSGVSLEYFSRIDDTKYKMSVDVYKRVLQSMFE